MIISIHQPDFIPYLGFFSKLYKSDIFILQDNVKFNKYYGRRNKLISNNNSNWITVPIKNISSQSLYNEINISYDSNWIKKHKDFIYTNYHNTSYYNEISDIYISSIEKKYNYLIDLNIDLINKIIDYLSIETKIKKSSELIEHTTNNPTENIINIIKKCNGQHYISGECGINYLDIDKFDNLGITVAYNKFICREYTQESNKFLPYMSILDCLFNCGYETKNYII